MILHRRFFFKGIHAVWFVLVVFQFFFFLFVVAVLFDNELDYLQMGDPSVEVTEESRDASQEAKAKAMEAISEGIIT